MSQFLIGSVAVGLVFVEGPTGDLKFSIRERGKVVAEVQEGLTWLAEQELRANVSWAYDIKTISLNVAPDPTLPNDYEPLEAHWRNPAMASLGFTPDLQGVRDYVASLRANLATDWGYVAFFVKYPLHHFAYAGKPRIVMSYDNGNWGPDNIDRIFTHETGHIFGCSDEYRESGCLCTTKHGYLQVINGNCQPCALSFVPCLMERNTWTLCSFTREHLGWRDSQGDDVLDPIRKCIVKPGEYFLSKEDILANAGRVTAIVLVRHLGDRPIQVGSHYHFFEVNRALEFDRASAYGMRLNIPAGTAVRFEPGEEKQVNLVAYAGNRIIYGHNNLTTGSLDPQIP